MVEVFLKFGWLLFLGVAFFVLLVRLENIFKRGENIGHDCFGVDISH